MKKIRANSWMVYGMAAILIFVLMSSNYTISSAAEKGTAYTASVNRTYQHPVNGNISEVQFSTQLRGEESWSSVSSEIMQENLGGEYCSDYRFQIPSEEVIVQCSLYVTPMGRSVLFFLTFSGLQEGNSDFILSINTEKEAVSDSSSIESGSDITEESNQEPAEDKKAVDSTQDITSVQTAVQADARQLLDSAKGLTVSDESILEDTVMLETGKSDIVGKETEEWILPLPWEFVWQCILIMTLPALVIGGILMSFKLLVLGKDKE